MDPLSITLAVITIATALKDIIETAQVIQDSFSKLPQNYRSAQRLAQQLLDISHGMEEIYREHKEILNKKESLKNAIINLQKEMESAQTQCARLIPPVVEKNSKTGRLKFAIYSFWNRKKVERLLLELKDHVYGCAQHFQLLSGIRTEAHVVEMRETLVQYTTRGSVAVHGHNSLGNTDMPHSGSGNVTDTQLCAFTQSTPMPITRIPNTIPVHDLSNAYLRREVGIVNLSLRSILTRWSQNLPTNVQFLGTPASWHLERLPISNIVAHQNAVVHAFRFQSRLRDTPSDLWFCDADLAMDNLVFELTGLDMYEDAIVLSALRVDLWKVIGRQQPSQTSSLGLVQALKVLASIFSYMGNRRQAYSKSEEAISILRSLAATPAVVPFEKDDMAILMFGQAINVPYSHRIFRVYLAVYACWMLEGALGITPYLSGIDISSISNWVVISENNNISDEQWFTYAESLLLIVYTHPPNFPESHKVAKLALAILNHLLTKYPGSSKVQIELVAVLTYLSKEMDEDKMDEDEMDEMDLQVITENLKYIQQNVTLLRRLVPFNPQRYVLNLARALWSQREALAALGRSVEAEDAYQDMISLKDLAAAPRHPDLQIPSETQATFYAQLAERHWDANRITDAVYAAQSAVSQYSALEFMNPGQSRMKHISAMSALCKYLNDAKQYDAVLTEGDKAIKMIDNLNIFGSDFNPPPLIHSYSEILREMMDALEFSRPGTRALAQAEDINNRIRKFVRSGKVCIDDWNSHLAQSLVTYARVLQQNALIKEALEHLQDVLDKEMYNDFGEAVIIYVDCFQQLQTILHKEGGVDKVLRYSREARRFVEKHLGPAFKYKLSKVRRLDLDYISLLLGAGRYPEALELSKLIVSEIRRDLMIIKIDDTAAPLAAALNSLALVQLYSCIPNDAVANATESLSLRQESFPAGDLDELDMYNEVQYFGLLTLSNGLHDTGEVEEALSRLDETEKAAQKRSSVDSMEALEVTGNDSYETLLFDRSRILFTKGDYPEAVKLIQNVEIIQREKSRGHELSALGESFATTLSYSHVLYCTLGRHDEGLAAANELAKLKAHIRSTSPTFAQAMDLKFEYLAKRGSWKAVQDAKDRLICTHQNHT